MENEDFSFSFDENSDSLSENEASVDLENNYYNAKALRENDFQAAIEQFKLILQKDGLSSEWSFKALKQLIKLHFSSGLLDKSLEYYKEFLALSKTNLLAKNYVEKSILRLLEFVSSTNENLDYLNQIYQETLNVGEFLKNSRLLFQVNLKQAKMYFDQGDLAALFKKLRFLKNSCLKENGEEDFKKGTQLLEIYALEIQAYSLKKDYIKLKELYNKSLSVKSAIPHPKILAIIRECGGKMHMRQEEWVSAQKDFFESFKNYDEVGSPHRIKCLKYLIIANMLMMSKINPFDSPEIQSYKTHPEIEAFTGLVNAFQENDIIKFERLLKENKNTKLEDDFLKDYVETLLYKIQIHFLLKEVNKCSQSVISLDSLAVKLGTTTDIVSNLVILSLLEEKINGELDQPTNCLYLKAHGECQNSKFCDLVKDADNISKEFHLYFSSIFI